MTQHQQNNLKRTAAIASVCTAILLILAKFYAFWKTDSLAIFSSFIDSITDLFASMVSFIAIYFSTKPASFSHRYGYGKAEALSALLQAVFVGISGIFVISDGIKRLINPIEITETNTGIAIMLFSILATLLLVLFQNYVAKKTNSLAVKSDSAHYVVDFLTNSAVIISLILVRLFGFVYFDIIAALFISIYLLYNAYQLAHEAIDLITDKELDISIRTQIENIVKKNKNIKGMHDFRSRSLGDIYYFELHLELDGNIPLYQAHKLTDSVEKAILKLYPNSQIMIHQDPYGIKEDRLDHELTGSCDLP